MKARSFQVDFLKPALLGLKSHQAQRVAIALDAAIAFGALEHAQGNDSLQDLAAVEAKYWDNVGRLAKGR